MWFLPERLTISIKKSLAEQHLKTTRPGNVKREIKRPLPPLWLRRLLRLPRGRHPLSPFSLAWIPLCRLRHRRWISFWSSIYLERNERYMPEWKLISQVVCYCFQFNFNWQLKQLLPVQRSLSLMLDVLL